MVHTFFTGHLMVGVVVIGDLAGKRDVLVDYQENILAGLCMKTSSPEATAG